MLRECRKRNGMAEPWNTLFTTFGLTGGLLAIAIFTVVRGDWIPKKSHDATIALMQTHFERELATVNRLRDEQINRLERANDDWRMIAMHGLDAAEEAALVGKVLVQGNSRSGRSGSGD